MIRSFMNARVARSAASMHAMPVLAAAAVQRRTCRTADAAVDDSFTTKVPALMKRASLLGHKQQFEIRHATAADVDRIMAFEQSLAKETESIDIEPAGLRLGALGTIGAPHVAHVALAHHRGEEDKVVAYLAFSKQWSVWHGGFMTYILSVIVNPEARGTGLFTGMFEHAQNMVRGDRMSVGVRLYVARDNALAISAYQKHGMTIEPFDIYKWSKDADSLPGKTGAPLPGTDPLFPSAFPDHHPWTIRRAESRDLDTLVSMQLRAAQETGAEGVTEASIRRGVALPWAEPYSARIYVAEADGQVIASTIVANEWSTWKGGVVYWLSGCYTVPEYRGKGVMSSLHQFCKQEAVTEGGATGLRMAVPRGNEAAARAATRLGLELENYHLMAWVDPAGAGCLKFVN